MNGHVVSDSAQYIFHLLVFYCQHQYRVTRDTDHSFFALVNLGALCGKHDLEKNLDSTITEYVKSFFKDITKTFEMIEEPLFSKALGASGVPLNYAIRTYLSPSDGADNPGTNHTSNDANMIARVLLLLELGVGDEEMGPFHDIFQVYQKKVYDILFTIFSANEAWVYLETSCKEKRGPKLLLALYVHYLVPNMVDHLSVSLTCMLQNLDYHG